MTCLNTQGYWLPFWALSSWFLCWFSASPPSASSSFPISEKPVFSRVAVGSSCLLFHCLILEHFSEELSLTPTVLLVCSQKSDRGTDFWTWVLAFHQISWTWVPYRSLPSSWPTHLHAIFVQTDSCWNLPCHPKLNRELIAFLNLLLS